MIPQSSKNTNCFGQLFDNANLLCIMYLEQDMNIENIAMDLQNVIKDYELVKGCL